MNIKSITLATALLAGLAAASLAGCASPEPDSFVGPSGKVTNTATCEFNATNCYKQAQATCGGSYQVLSSESSTGGLITGPGFGHGTWWGRMTYQCGASDGKLATFAPPAAATINSNVNADVTVRQR
jgi:hypothetical protein